MELIAKAIYITGDSRVVSIEYDRLAPCQDCGLPVCEATEAGTTICPWCYYGNDPPDLQYRYTLAQVWHDKYLQMQ